MVVSSTMIAINMGWLRHFLRGNHDAEMAELRSQLQEARARRKEAEKEHETTIIRMQADPVIQALAGTAEYIKAPCAPSPQPPWTDENHPHRRKND